MIKVEVPKAPAQAWRDIDSIEKSFRVGYVARIAWELVKPVLAWLAFIVLIGIWAVVYTIVKVLSSK
jgi:hypothetical protein